MDFKNMEKKVSLLTFSVGVVLAFVAGAYLNTLLGPDLQRNVEHMGNRVESNRGLPEATSQDQNNPAQAGSVGSNDPDPDPDAAGSSSNLNPADLEIKKGVFEGLLEGTIIEIEELDQSRTKYTLDVKGERSFKNGDSLEIVGEFIAGPETKCVDYQSGAGQNSPIDCGKIGKGDHILVYPKEDITSVVDNQPLELIKIMRD